MTPHVWSVLNRQIPSHREEMTGSQGAKGEKSVACVSPCRDEENVLKWGCGVDAHFTWLKQDWAQWLRDVLLLQRTRGKFSVHTLGISPLPVTPDRSYGIPSFYFIKGTSKFTTLIQVNKSHKECQEECLPASPLWVVINYIFISC